ncbi:MAG: AraC family transcriptional regulator [Sphingobium sp.]
MNWSLSEFLNLIDLRSQSWCVIELGNGSGIRLPHSDTVFFHAVLDGSARLSGITGEPLELKRHDILFSLSGCAHAIRTERQGHMHSIDLLNEGQYVDTPPTVIVGDGPVETRLLSGRLRIRWPSGGSPRGLPPFFMMHGEDNLVDFDATIRSAHGEGASALLTRLATMMFVKAFREHPRCQAIFRDSNTFSPVARAQRIIEKHPFQRWTVDALARKVGMGRSNFASQFTHQTGKTPMDVLAEERMKHAARFLETTNLKIAEISERIGYRSEAAFSRRFSDYFGTTPGKLRRQLRVPH